MRIAILFGNIVQNYDYFSSFLLGCSDAYAVASVQMRRHICAVGLRDRGLYAMLVELHGQR